MVKKMRITAERNLVITLILNFCFLLALIIALHTLSSSFDCTLHENAVFGKKKTNFLCLFTNFLVCKVILAIGIATVLADSVLEVTNYCLKKKSTPALNLKLRLGNGQGNVSPKTAVRKAWSEKFEETSVL